MKRLIGISLVMTMILGWLAVDAGFRHSTIRTARKASREAVNELEARMMIGDVVDGITSDDAQSMVLVGMHHASTHRLYPRALGRAVAREFGPPNREVGLALLKRAADHGSSQAEWLYWSTVGWPEGDELLSLVKGGNEMAALKLVDALASEGCQVQDAALSDVEEAAAALDGPWFGDWEEPDVNATERVRGSISRIRAWKAESCAKPAHVT
ncbi:MAG: hypothetical protein ACI9W4_000700 [Rhodothermales bacterium]|jgi:hypothetical protein